MNSIGCIRICYRRYCKCYCYRSVSEVAFEITRIKDAACMRAGKVQKRSIAQQLQKIVQHQSNYYTNRECPGKPGRKHNDDQHWSWVDRADCDYSAVVNVDKLWLHLRTSEKEWTQAQDACDLWSRIVFPPT